MSMPMKTFTAAFAARLAQAEAVETPLVHRFVDATAAGELGVARELSSAILNARAGFLSWYAVGVKEYLRLAELDARRRARRRGEGSPGLAPAGLEDLAEGKKIVTVISAYTLQTQALAAMIWKIFGPVEGRHAQGA